MGLRLHVCVRVCFCQCWQLWAGGNGRAGTAQAETCQDVPFDGWYGVGRNWQDLGQIPWGARGGFGFAAIGGRLAVFGGEDSTGKLKNDVFFSSNGVAWTEDRSQLWAPRSNFLHVTHNDYLYILSGRGCKTSNDDYCRDVWRALVPAPTAPFALQFENVGLLPRAGRERGLALSFKGRLYDIGGCSSSGCFVDVTMLDSNGVWHTVAIREPTCSEENRVCFWSINFIGRWPSTSEYRLVGVAHEDSIWIFGGVRNTNVLRLTPSNEGAGKFV